MTDDKTKPRMCMKCFSVIVDPIRDGKEKCRMCGHEQDEPNDELVRKDGK